MPPLRFDKHIHNFYSGLPPAIWGTAGGILFPDFFQISDEIYSTIHLHRYMLLSSHFTDTASLPDGLSTAEKS
jgi:hypothetical protein